MDCLIEAKEIYKDFELGDVTVHALRNVSFQIRRGELIVILGPSGSGKSTLLNILGGIETATEGKILYEERELNWSDPREFPGVFAAGDICAKKVRQVATAVADGVIAGIQAAAMC